MSKYIIPFVVVGYLVFSFSCKKVYNTTGCGDLSDYDDYSRIQSLSLSVGKVMEDGIFEFFSDSLSHSYQEAAIAIIASDVETYSHKENKTSGFNFSFIPKAVACSPIPPEPVQKVTKISITSNDTVHYSTTYEPGEELSNLFYVNTHNRKSDRKSIENFIAHEHDYPRFGNLNTQMIFTLRDKVLLQNHKLSIMISFDDGREFQFSTNEFVIKE